MSTFPPQRPATHFLRELVIPQQTQHLLISTSVAENLVARSAQRNRRPKQSHNFAAHRQTHVYQRLSQQPPPFASEREIVTLSPVESQDISPFGSITKYSTSLFLRLIDGILNDVDPPFGNVPCRSIFEPLSTDQMIPSPQCRSRSRSAPCTHTSPENGLFQARIENFPSPGCICEDRGGTSKPSRVTGVKLKFMHTSGNNPELKEMDQHEYPSGVSAPPSAKIPGA